jgi:hypothetical protein
VISVIAKKERHDMNVRTLAVALIVAGGLVGFALAQQFGAPGQQNTTDYVVQALRFVGPSQGQAQDLARQYVKAEKEEQKKEIRKKLTDLLAQQFDQRNEQQQKELENLEKQIVELKALLKKRADGRSAILDRRFEQLILDVEGLGWQAPDGKPAMGTLRLLPATMAPNNGRD